MDITEKFKRVVRAIVGLPADLGQPPQIDRLAWYRAQVTTCATDGSICDVQTEDTRVGGENGVKVLVGIPGLVGVVQPGAIVMLGWERGDPARPRCMPMWEAGAMATQISILANLVYLGAQQGAVALALATKVNSELGKIATALSSHTHSGVTTGPGNTGASSSTYSAGDVSAAQVKGL